MHQLAPLFPLLGSVGHVFLSRMKERVEPLDEEFHSSYVANHQNLCYPSI